MNKPVEYQTAKDMGVCDVPRWDHGIDHHPKSEALYRFISKHNFTDQDDSLDLSSGGDGDNGEELMYALDAYFDAEELMRLETGVK
jgi:hypothetical protein